MAVQGDIAALLSQRKADRAIADKVNAAKFAPKAALTTEALAAAGADEEKTLAAIAEGQGSGSAQIRRPTPQRRSSIMVDYERNNAEKQQFLSDIDKILGLR